MYHPSEVELAETTKAVLAEAARIKPDRMVLDSLSEFRMLAENPLRYRRQILALKRYFARQQTPCCCSTTRRANGATCSSTAARRE